MLFNMQRTDTGVLRPETNNTFEIGLKSQFLDRRMATNFAASIDDFDN